MPPAAPRPFLVDIGNVLCVFDFDAMLERLAARSRGSVQEAMGEFDTLKDRYESGAWDDERFIAHVTAAVQFEGDRDEFVRIWSEIFTLNAPMAATVASLAGAGHPLYLLSNTNGLHLDYLVRTFPVFSHFAGGVFSHLAGSIKPAPPIYETAIENFALDPAGTLYVDDLPQNIAAGRRLGFRSHQYSPDRHDEFLSWLDAEGVDLDPGRGDN